MASSFSHSFCILERKPRGLVATSLGLVAMCESPTSTPPTQSQSQKDDNLATARDRQVVQHLEALATESSPDATYRVLSQISKS